MTLIKLFRSSFKSREHIQKKGRGPYFKIRTMGRSKPVFIQKKEHGPHEAYTVERQWLEQFWNHEDMFETVEVRANEY